jgi:hypothetical protein
MNTTINGKRYDIGAGHLGNGITFWNRAEEVGGDYKKLGHISESGGVTLDENLPDEVKRFITQRGINEKEIETRLINLLTKIEMRIPSNFEDMLAFIIWDMRQTASPSWTDKDLANSLCNFIEQ